MATEFDSWVEQARGVPIESEIARRGIKLRASGAERIGPCPKCGGTDRFSINVKEGVWNCRQCKTADVSGDVIGLVEWLDGCAFAAAVETLTQEAAPQKQQSNGRDGSSERRTEVASYDYVDENGALLYQVVRFEPKDFAQRRPDKSNGGWEWSTKGTAMVPYHLPETLEAIASEQTVFICEGEKDVDNLIRLGARATCNPRGAGKWANCKLDDYFRDAHVVIIADNDAQSKNKKTGELLYHSDGRPRFAGWDHAHDVARHLAPLAASVRVIDLKKFWPACAEKGDITDWIKAGGTLDLLYGYAEQLPEWAPGDALQPPAMQAPLLLALIDIRAWQDHEPQPRAWILRDRVPARNITLFSGQGGVGKTLLLQQLSVATVLARDWFGELPEPGPVLFITAEDDEQELHFRYHAIARHYGTSFNDLAKAGLHLLSLAGKDATMAFVDNKTGIVRPTKLFETMRETARELRPRWIGLDTAADIFVINERDRSEVRQCISLLRGVCLDVDTAVILTSHPSLTGISSGTGLSGNTAWHNSVRARQYLRSEKKDAAAADDADDDDAVEVGAVRILESMKSNYSGTAAPIRMIWKDGLFHPDRQLARSPAEKAARDDKARGIFVTILERFNAQHRPVSDKSRANNFAPNLFADEPEARQLSHSRAERLRILRKVMADLFSANQLQIIEGPLDVPKSKRYPSLFPLAELPFGRRN